MITKEDILQRIVNYKVSSCDIYIGTQHHKKFHYGNPFSHLKSAKIVVKDRQEACNRFDTWLRGTSDFDVEQERRIWILNRLTLLDGKILGCVCAPKQCHGETYLHLIDELSSGLILIKNGIVIEWGAVSF